MWNYDEIENLTNRKLYEDKIISLLLHISL